MNYKKKEKKFLSSVKTKELNLELQQMASKRKVAKRWNKSYPLTGSPKSLVILVNFADKVTVNNGWGNSAGNYFAPGRHRIEFWWNDKRIGQTYFDVN